MKKLFTLLTAIVLLLTSVSIVFAQDTNFRKNVVLPSGETVNHDYIAAGNNVEIAGTVNGDVIVAGGQVSISGKVNGDVIAAGGQVTVSGSVSQNVRVAGGQISVSGKIGRNLTAAGGTVTLNEGASLTGTLVVAGGTVDINAPLSMDVKVAGGNLSVNNTISGNLDAAVGTLELSSGALIKGNLNYWSNADVSLDSGAKVLGGTAKHQPVNNPDFELRGISNAFAGLGNVLRLMTIVSTLVLLLIFVYFFSGFAKRSSEIIQTQAWKTLGWGLLLLIVVPIAVLLLFLTILGIPLGLLLMTSYIIAIFTSRVVFINWLGVEALARTNQKQSVVWAAVVGFIIYYLLSLVPIIGGWVTFIAILFGFGTAFMAIRNRSEVAVVTSKKK